MISITVRSTKFYNCVLLLTQDVVEQVVSLICTPLHMPQNLMTPEVTGHKAFLSQPLPAQLRVFHLPAILYLPADEADELWYAGQSSSISTVEEVLV